VIYDDRHTSGLRFPFDIPVEDFLFGFALVTAVPAAVGAPAVAGSKVRGRENDRNVSEYQPRSMRVRRRLRRLVGANPGYHRHLQISAQRMRLAKLGRGLRLLDAGCGTEHPPPRCCRRPHAEIVAWTRRGHAGRGRRQTMAGNSAVRA
jgi:hypothetical protein